jgi:hypothetical protein
MVYRTTARLPDPIILSRVCYLLSHAVPALPAPTTAAWIGRVLALVDGGPIIDPPRLGPALRACGFHHSFRRQGRGRAWVWYPPPRRPTRGRRPNRPGQIEQPIRTDRAGKTAPPRACHAGERRPSRYTSRT